MQCPQCGVEAREGARSDVPDGDLRDLFDEPRVEEVEDGVFGLRSFPETRFVRHGGVACGASRRVVQWQPHEAAPPVRQAAPASIVPFVVVAGPNPVDARDLATVEEHLNRIGCELLGIIENRIAPSRPDV